MARRETGRASPVLTAMPDRVHPWIGRSASIPHQVAQEACCDRELGEREAGAGNLLDRGADALDLALPRRHPGVDRGRAGSAVDDHLGGQPALGRADGIERAIEREPVEVIGYVDAAGGVDDAIELEEVAGRE